MANASALKETIMDASTALVAPSCHGGERMKKELNQDDLVEILARLPVKSLLRFKSVSKLWYSLIPSPHFISKHSSHSHHNNQVSLFLLPYSSAKKVTRRSRNTVTKPPNTTVSFGVGDITEQLTFSGHLESVEIVGCFNGVVCLSLSERPHQKYALWNPATRQLRQIGDASMVGPNRCDLTNIEKGWYGSGFCFDPVINAFKVAQIRLIVTAAGEARAHVNVFSTVTNSWNEKKNVPVPYRIGISGSSDMSTICGASCVNGYIHWHVALIRDDPGSEDDCTICFELEDAYILSYDMIGEVFKRIEMPNRPIFGYYHLTSYKGSLAVFSHKRTGCDGSYDEVDVWVLSDCSGANQSWSKLLTCKPSIKIRCALGFFRKDNVDLILLCKYEDCSLYLYDPQTGETKKFWRKGNGTHTFLYSESLASLH